MKGKSFSKRIVSAMVAVIMVMAMVPSIGVFAREYAAEVSINGVTVDFKNEPYSKNDIIFVPLEEIGGYLNLNITKEGNVYTILRMGQTLKVESGNLVAFLDGKEVVLSTNPVEKNGITYVPAELFSKGFGCPVTVSEDKRSADIVPNVYRVSITEQAAAAVSAAVPDKDVLGTGASSVDTIFNNAAVFPQLEKSLFYMIDLSAFNGLKIKNALLSLNIDKSEYSPTLRIERTAPWKKGEVTYNTQPVSYEKEYVTGLVAESNYVDKQYDIVSLVNAAQQAGETLAIKLMGIPHSSKKNSKNNSFTIRGVNTTKAPYVEIYLDEVYTFPIKTAAQDTEDYEEQRYSRIALLKSLGVFTENDEFPLDLTEGVQRQEFVKYALRLRNATVQESVGEQFFSDVPADAPFYKEVMTAHSMGLVSGWQGIAFRPYDNITLGEAITILGRMLNYNIFADERGGFTPGYFAAARNGDLYNGAEIEKEALSFKKMFKLLEDALDAKMLNVRSYSSNGTAEYTFDANMTILTEYWNAQSIEGVVTANEYSGVADPNAGKEGTIVIDNRKELKLTFEPYNEFLGYRVKAYYDRYEDKLLYMGIKEYDIKEINLCDITGTGQDASNITFTYENGKGNIARESFSKAKVIYNGKYIASGSVSPQLLNADGGSIKLVGNSLAVIKAYKTLTVYSVESEAEVIYDKYDSYDNVLRLKGKDYIIRDISGKEVELSTLNTDDILSVAKSFDGELITAILSTTKIAGEITAVENLGTDSEVLTINGSEYKTRNRSVNRENSTVEFWYDYVKIGANGTFLVDAFGSIVGFNPIKTSNVKGYFLTMANKGSALSSTLQIAVMVEGSEKYVVYDLADKVKIDGKSYKVSSQETEVKNKFKDAEYGRLVGEYVTQGIIFDVNSDGKINKIDTAHCEPGVEDENNSLQRRRKIDDGELKYKSNGSLGGKYYLRLSRNLGVFGYEEGNLSEYETKTGGFSNDGDYKLDIYTVGKRTPEAAIIYRVMDSKSDSSVGDDPYLMLVDRIVTTFDDDGLEVKKIYYYSGTSRGSVIVPDEMISKLEKKTLAKPVAGDYTGGEESQAYKDALAAYNADPGNANVYNQIERGDIVRFESNDRGEITAIEECYDITDKKIVVNRIGSFNHHYRAYGGYTGIVDDSYIKITSTSDISDNGTYTWVDSSKFSGFCRYEVSSAGVEVIPATLKDVRTVENVPYNPTGILLYAAYENLRKNVWLVELARPENTGLYTLKYASGTTDSVSGITEGSVRCGNDGSVSITATEPTRAGHAFKFWKNEANGSTYAPGDTFTLTANTTLTAQWAETPTHVITLKDTETGISKDIDFAPMKWDKNSQQLVETKFVVPDAQKAADYGFSKDGWKLIGWDGYSIGQEISITGNTTLEAKMIQNWSGIASTTDLTPNSDGYYEITNGEQLAWFAAQVNAGNAAYKAKLMNDIYLNNFADCGDGKQINETTANWFDTPANVENANSWNSFMMKSFAGTFDGCGYTIYGLYMQGGDGTGFFSSVAGGTVKNVTFKDAYVVSTSTHKHATYGYYNGVNYEPVAIVAANVTAAGTTATFSDITTYGKITATAAGDVLTAGGIIGRVDTTINMTNCTNRADIIHLVLNNGEPFRYNKTEGETRSTYVEVIKCGIGGIIGFMGDKNSTNDGADVTLTRCFNYGNLIVPYSNDRIGGIVGHFRNGSLDLTSTCGNAGKIRSLNVDGEMVGTRTSSYTSATVGGTNQLTGGSVAIYDPNETIN